MVESRRRCVALRRTHHGRRTSCRGHQLRSRNQNRRAGAHRCHRYSSVDDDHCRRLMRIHHGGRSQVYLSVVGSRGRSVVQSLARSPERWSSDRRMIW